MPKKNWIKRSPKTKEEWLTLKNQTIGGSEAAMVVNKSPWGNANDLYTKIIRNKAIVVAENDRMREGTKAEDHIRALFALDNGLLKVKNPPKKGYWFYQRKDKPYISCTPDGLAIDKEGKLWGIEIKDVEMRKKETRNIWENNDIPDQYYYQVLQYMLTFQEMEGVVLVAHQKYFKHNDKTDTWDFDYAVDKPYKILRNEVIPHLNYLEKKETEFFEVNIKGHKRPKTIIHI